MKIIACLLLIVFLIPFSAHAVVYKWRDDNGVVNFTDNADKIPAKYKKRVKKIAVIETDTNEPKPGAVQDIQRKTPATTESAAKEKDVLYGGHNEEWWRSAFGKIREELKTVQERLPEKKKSLEVARRKMTIYQYPRYRQAYFDLKSEIEKDEARIVELNKQADSLENDASRAAVPFDWRK